MTSPVVEVTSGEAARSRPTAQVVIGGKTYVALAPKMAVWVTAVDQVNKAIGQTGDTLAAARTLHDTLVGDDTDPNSVGVLVQALEPEDIAELVTRLKDRRDDIDMDDLWYGAIEILGEFQDWATQRGQEMGLKIPKLVAKPKTKQAAVAHKPAAPKKKSAAKKAAPKKRVR